MGERSDVGKELSEYRAPSFTVLNFPLDARGIVIVLNDRLEFLTVRIRWQLWTYSRARRLGRI